MLERATACLKTGVARETVRCTTKAPRSTRTLHSSFWSHGAGDLDLPPWAVAMLPTPSDLSLRYDDKRARVGNHEGKRTVTQQVGQGPGDGVFLDFLYPQQALAWLHRSNTQHSQKMERHNASRLPDGFVVASRGYASRASPKGRLTRKEKDEILFRDDQKPEESSDNLTSSRKDERGLRLSEDTDFRSKDSMDPGYTSPNKAEDSLDEGTEGSRPSLKRRDPARSHKIKEDAALKAFRDRGQARSSVHAQKFNKRSKAVKRTPESQILSQQHRDEENPSQHSSDSGYDVFDEQGFSDSPMALAEQETDSLHRLRGIMAQTSKQPARFNDGRKIVHKAWAAYQSLHEVHQEEARLKSELLSWLSRQVPEVADQHSAELYHSIPVEQRTLQDYENGLSVFLRGNQHLSASKLHREALRNLENGHQISRTLFKYAIDNNMWRLAIRTEGRHREFYGDTRQTALFWLHVSETPQLISRAFKLATLLRPTLQSGRVDAHTHQFCATFFREAITQEFLQADATLYVIETFSKQEPPRDHIRELFTLLAEVEKDASNIKIFEATLHALLSADARIPYTRMHYLVSSIYRMYEEMPDAQPSHALRIMLLDRVMERALALEEDRKGFRSLSVESLVDEWKRAFGRLSRDVHHRLLVYYSKAGSVRRFEQAMQDFKASYPAYEDQKGMLWTTIRICARNSDLDGAQQAFAAVKRTMTEHGEAPDLRCWNILLNAHSRVDDVEGAWTNLQNLINDAKLVPDAYSFQPLASMYARRGDVDGVEGTLRQYDELRQTPRPAFLEESLMIALVKSDEVEDAENILLAMTEQNKAGELTGSIVKAYNIVLTSYGMARDMNSTMRVYRKMREETIALDTNSYAALILALVARRHFNAARTVMADVMKRRNVLPTALHYSVMMAGWTNAGYPENALELHAEMKRQNIRENSSSRAAALHARAAQEHNTTFEAPRSSGDSLKPLEATREGLHQILETDEDVGDAAETPLSNKRSVVWTDDALAAHFDFLIFLHGKRKLFDVVEQLVQQYKDGVAQRGIEQEEIPIRMLTALMSAQWRAGHYPDVETSWKKAKQQAEVLASTVPVPSLGGNLAREAGNTPSEDDAANEVNASEALLSDKTAAEEGPTVSGESAAVFQPINMRPRTMPIRKVPTGPTIDINTSDTPTSSTNNPNSTRPVAGRRHILTRPLRYYLAALHAQNRHQDIIDTVSSLLSQGWVLDNRTFNFFIECLVRADPPLVLLAFTLTERFLMPDFPGWNVRPIGRPIPRSSRALGLQHMRARYLKPGALMPQYRTMVRLGAALMSLMRMEAVGRGGRDGGKMRKYVGSMREIKDRAPNTLFAVRSMPKLKDPLQTRLLGGR